MTLILERFLARTLAVLWAGFWLWFFVVESLYYDTAQLVIVLWVALGVCFGIVVAVAWRWEATGGFLLAATGVAAGAVYALRHPPHLPLRVVIVTAALFSVPPVVAGMLFLLHHRGAVKVAHLH